MLKKFNDFIKESYNSNLGFIKSRTNFYLINESQGSKSMSQAIKLVMNTWGWNREKSEDLVKNKIRTEITPLKEDPISKFTLGVTRMYCDNQISDAKTISDINATLKLLSAHLNEYDKNLNGLSADELISKFRKNREFDKERKKREIKKLKFGACDYEIVKIDSYNDAKKYYKYTNPNSRWCITHMENMYDTYTCDGINQIYFCLKNGFENIKPVVGENAPLDEYGLSMLSIIVNEDEELAYCTCRWNHDNNGTDSVMDEIEVSKVVNLDFYETFKPNTKWKDLLDNAIQKFKNGVSPEEIFDRVFGFSNGYLMVKLKNKWNLIDKNGKYLLDKWFDYIGSFREGYARVRTNDKFNFIDINGEYLSDKWFEDAGDFSEGYAIVALNGEYNFIDKNVEYLSDEWFDDVDPFYSDSYARVEKDNQYNLINKEGKFLFNEWFDDIKDFDDTCAIVELDYKYNLINEDGELLSDKWFDEIKDFEHFDDNFNYAYAKVKLDNQYNFINRNGEFLSDEWFDEIYDFDDGRAGVKLGYQYNFIDVNGKLMSDEWFDEIVGDYFYDDYVKVNIDNKYNFINKKCEFISDKWFDDAEIFELGFSKVKLDNQYNLINEDGELLSKEWFDEITEYNSDYAIVKKNYWGWNIIKEDGEFVSFDWFDEICNFKDNYIVVELNDKGWNIINLNGEYESDEWFDNEDDAMDYFYELL